MDNNTNNNMNNNDIFNNAFNDSYNTVKKLYKDVGFIDQYGGDVFLCFIYFLIPIFIFLYFKTIKDLQPIKDDWANQRCKPTVIPFAGFINKPDNMTVAEFTQQNFTFCIQSILVSMSSFALQPLTFLTSSLSSIYGDLSGSIDSSRTLITNIRTNMANITNQILNRIMNFTVPVTKMIIGFNDLVKKVVAILTSGLYTSLSTYYALKAFLGALVQLIIYVLISAVAVIISLWLVPVTWPMAITGTAIFSAVSISLAIFLVFLTQVLHIKTSGFKIPKVPSKPKIRVCFDKNTMMKMADRTMKKISEIKIGDELWCDGDKKNRVTSKLKLLAINNKMYQLGDVIVSGTHRVRHDGVWIFVNKHPHAIPVENYDEPVIYCLNTTCKEFTIGDYIFSDWDEITEENYIAINNYLKSNNADYKEKDLDKTDIHKLFDMGFDEYTYIHLKDRKIAKISCVKLGDILKNGEKVYGLVEILNSDSLAESKKLYHLLTDKNSFYLNGIQIGDYNSLIDKCYI
uniref:Vint domain-containing protein n=1 Tax=viral metagenome TaxID=1070528 RepID=A0A6C0CWT7_9ZZZZ